MLRHLPTYIVGVICLLCLLWLLRVTYKEMKSPANGSTAETVLYYILRVMLEDRIEIDPSDDTYRMKIEDNISNCPILRDNFYLVLLVDAVLLAELAAILFVEHFTFVASSTCYDGFLTFCFPTCTKHSSINSTERIQNCATVKGDVICYRILVDIFIAAGVIASLFVILNLITRRVNMWAIKHYWKDEDSTKSYMYKHITILCIGAIILLIFCILGAVSAEENANSVWDVFLFIFQYFIVILAILLGAVTLIICVLKQDRPNQRGRQ